MGKKKTGQKSFFELALTPKGSSLTENLLEHSRGPGDRQKDREITF
jgi:hypothetical protein